MTQQQSGLAALQRSIRARLVVVTAVILICVVAVITTLTARTMTRVLDDRFEAQLSQMADQGAQSVARFLDTQALRLDRWSASPALRSLLRDPDRDTNAENALFALIGADQGAPPWLRDVIVLQGANVVWSLDDTAPAILPATDSGDWQLGTSPNGPTLTLVRAVPAPNDTHIALLVDVGGMGALLPEGTTLTEADGRALITQPDATDITASRAVPDTPLGVTSSLPREAVTRPVRNLTYLTVAIGTLGSVIGLLAALFFTGRVTASMQHLTDAARREAARRVGDSPPARAGTDAQDGFDGYGTDDVGVLAEVFDTLRRTTDELTHANAALESRNIELDQTRRSLTENLGRLERELDSARTLQLGMVPKPDAGDAFGDSLDIAAVMDPAREVGGDFFDFFRISADTVCVLIGDVSDKGTPSALFMSRTMSLVRFSVMQLFRLRQTVPDPSDVLGDVNKELCHHNETRMFVTLFLAFINQKTGVVSYANAGHISPLHIQNGAIAPVTTTHPDLPLAVRKTASFRSDRINLRAGDQLVLYTDGITEAEDAGNAFFGEERMQEALRGASGGRAADSLRAVLYDVRAFAGEHDQFDDITLLVLGWHPPGAGPE